MRRPPIPGLVLADGWLAPYEREIQARLRLYDSRVAQLTRRYGSPEECARGYTRMGFNRNEQGEWVYREWAPAARELHLIGDFNGWDRSATPMVRDRHGVWEHAYYLRYRNNRRAYIEAFARLVDWSVPEILYTRTLRHLTPSAS